MGAATVGLNKNVLWVGNVYGLTLSTKQKSVKLMKIEAKEKFTLVWVLEFGRKDLLFTKGHSIMNHAGERLNCQSMFGP